MTGQRALGHGGVAGQQLRGAAAAACVASEHSSDGCPEETAAAAVRQRPSPRKGKSFTTLDSYGCTSIKILQSLLKLG